MQELQARQSQGDKGEMMAANKDGKHQIRKDESHLIHVLQAHPGFDAVTGAKKDLGHVQTYYPKEFERMQQTSAFVGQEVTILHDPRTEKEVKDAEKAAEATGTQLSGTPSATKPVSRMNKAELKEHYAKTFGEEAAEDFTVDDLRQAIEEKEAENK